MDTSEYNDLFYSEMFGKSPSKYYNVQRSKIKKIMELFRKHGAGKVLDVGCGDGLIASLIAKATGAEVHGVDVSKSSVKKAKQRGIKAKVVDINKQKLPFRENTFDAVFCGDILEHIYDSEKLIESVNRVLKPGGYAIISVPNIASWYNRVFLLFGLMPVWVESSPRTYTGNPLIKKGVGHIHAFTKRSLRELLQLKGFRVESMVGSPTMADGTREKWKEELWNHIDSVFSKSASLASTLICRAVKTPETNKKR